MDAALRKKLEEIAKGLKVTDRAVFNRKVKALVKEFTPKAIPKTVSSSFEKIRTKYNAYVEAEVKKREYLIPDVSHEKRYNILREKGIVPRKEMRSIQEIVTDQKGNLIKSPDVKVSSLTKYMKSSMRKTSRKQKMERSKEALIRASNFNFTEKEAASIKTQIEKMTAEEWEMFNVENGNLIGQLYENYHTETTAGFQPSLDYFNAVEAIKREMSRVVTATHKQYLKRQRDKRAAAGTKRRSGSTKVKKSRK